MNNSPCYMKLRFLLYFIVIYIALCGHLDFFAHAQRRFEVDYEKESDRTRAYILEKAITNAKETYELIKKSTDNSKRLISAADSLVFLLESKAQAIGEENSQLKRQIQDLNEIIYSLRLELSSVEKDLQSKTARLKKVTDIILQYNKGNTSP